MRKTLMAGTTAMLLGLGATFFAGPASADVMKAPGPIAPASCPQSASAVAHGSGHVTEPAQIRSGPSTSCPAPGASQTGDSLTYFCYVSGQGGTWTYLRNNRTHVVGWTKDSLLTGNGSSTAC